MSPATALRRGELSAGRLAALMNAPSIVCLALVLAYPIVYAGYLSLHEVSLRQLRTGEFPFAGLTNFARLVRDTNAHPAAGWVRETYARHRDAARPQPRYTANSSPAGPPTNTLPLAAASAATPPA